MSYKDTLGMSQKDRDILEFMKSFGEKKGYLPSYREIAEAFCVTQSTIYFHMDRLQRFKEIEKHGGRFVVKGLKYVRE